MKNKVVVFGAGAIGRGLLADIAFNSAFQVVFVDAVGLLVDKLVDCKEYCVHLEGKSEASHIISGYQALKIDNLNDIANEIADSAFVTTSVGGTNLGDIAGLIAIGLAKRKGILNILVCENWPKADHILSDMLVSRGCDKKRFTCVPCSVERMAKSAEKGLDVIVESEQSLYVDETRWVGDKPKIEELLFCKNIEAYYKRKLYTNNAGHVLLAYAGYLSGCELLYEALGIQKIRQDLIDLLNAASQVLIKDYNFTKADMECHIDNLICWRFSNRKLADTTKRVARDPLRKLGTEERLVALVRRLEKYGLATVPVSRVIAAAMRYYDKDDAGSVKLAEMIAAGGAEAVLTQICKFSPQERCYQECLRFFCEKN
jgi:mannitol-1-phosphate 5-dehydrogenase